MHSIEHDRTVTILHHVVVATHLSTNSDMYKWENCMHQGSQAHASTTVLHDNYLSPLRLLFVSAHIILQTSLVPVTIYHLKEAMYYHLYKY